MAGQTPIAISLTLSNGIKLDIKKDDLGNFSLNFTDLQQQGHLFTMISDDIGKLGRVLALCNVISASQSPNP